MTKKYYVEDGTVFLDSNIPHSWEKPKEFIVSVSIETLARLVDLFETFLPNGATMVDANYFVETRTLTGPDREWTIPNEYNMEEAWALVRYVTALGAARFDEDFYSEIQPMINAVEDRRSKLSPQ